MFVSLIQDIKIEIVSYEESKGKYPKRGQIVALHYEGFLADGTMFDSSRKRGRPLTFQIGAKQVIDGLDYAVSKVPVGARAKITIPQEHAYGTNGFPGLIPPNSTLIFDLALLSSEEKGIRDV